VILSEPGFACLRAGATILSGLRGNTTLWSIGQLPVPQWLAEVGIVTGSDPVFAGRRPGIRLTWVVIFKNGLNRRSRRLDPLSTITVHYAFGPHWKDAHLPFGTIE
jgi:hypothetical protein